MNLSQLNVEEYQFWKNLCLRDVQFKEISKLGPHATDYSITKQIRRYKENMSKKNYVNKLLKENPSNYMQKSINLTNLSWENQLKLIM